VTHFWRFVVLLVGWIVEGKPLVFNEVSCMAVLAVVVLGFRSLKSPFTKLITDLCFWIVLSYCCTRIKCRNTSYAVVIGKKPTCVSVMLIYYECSSVVWFFFLGTFTKLQKVTVSSIVSVCPHGTTHLSLNRFSWNLTILFWKSVKKFQVSLKSDKNNGYFPWCPMYICDNILLNSL